jgi:hypothetical protein
MSWHIREVMTYLEAVEDTPGVKELTFARVLVSPGKDVVGGGGHFWNERRGETRGCGRVREIVRNLNSEEIHLLNPPAFIPGEGVVVLG